MKLVIFYNMDSEKILFCYRDDKAKRIVVFQTPKEKRMMAAVPCVKRFAGKERPIKKTKLKKAIEKAYMEAGTERLWLNEELCDYLEMDKMEWPRSLLMEWFMGICDYHTLILADDMAGNAADLIFQKTEKLAMVVVLIFDRNREVYENIALDLYQKEGLVLQIFIYEKLKRGLENFFDGLVVKGRTALLDLKDGKDFLIKELPKTIDYYSFEDRNRLFLDTCRKNSYNTLTK